MITYFPKVPFKIIDSFQTSNSFQTNKQKVSKLKKDCLFQIEGAATTWVTETYFLFMQKKKIQKIKQIEILSLTSKSQTLNVRFKTNFEKSRKVEN